VALNENIENFCKELQLPMLNEHHHEILKLEADNRATCSRATLTKLAGFPTIKTLEQFDFDFTVGVNCRQIEELSTLEFVKRKENIILLGQSGVGKTHLAIALAYQAVQQRIKARFVTVSDLVMQMSNAKKEKKYDTYIRQAILAPSLLVIDEIGYFPMNKEDAQHFFQVISRRYERGATIVTSNLVFSQWSGIFANDKVVTTAILDRLLHHSHVINILGDSYRLKEKKEEGLVDSDLYKFQTKKLVKGVK